MKRAAVSHKEAAALGWTRIDPRPWGKLGARWAGPDGWLLAHCGHPTANYPWALYDPKGRMHLMGSVGPALNPTFGRAWDSLREPMRYVAEQREQGMARMDAIERTAPTTIRWVPR